MHRRDELGCLVEPDAVNRGVRPHAAGVGPGVTVERSLEVLSRDERDGAAAVAQREQRDLGTFEELLDHDVAHALQGAQRLVDILLRAADEDALPRREPVLLHDARRAGDGEPSGACHPGVGHDLLRERLRSFDPGRGRARAEDEEAEPTQRVREPQHQRHLGTDDDELDAE